MAAIISTIANGGTLYALQYPRTPEELAAFHPVVRRRLDALAEYISISPPTDKSDRLSGRCCFGENHRHYELFLEYVTEELKIIRYDSSGSPEELRFQMMLAQHVFYDTAEDYVRTIRGSTTSSLYFPAKSKAIACEKAGSGIPVTNL